jgi:hypothetical protein
MPDHVHMMISIPPKYAVSQVIGYVKGKSAIHLARVYGERRRQPSGPRSKSWLRNVVTSQPIRANSWSSQPVSRVGGRERCPHAIVARVKHENRPLILTRRLPLRDQVCPSDVRFRSLSPENCHSASGPIRSFRGTLLTSAQGEPETNDRVSSMSAFQPNSAQ